MRFGKRAEALPGSLRFGKRFSDLALWYDAAAQEAEKRGLNEDVDAVQVDEEMMMKQSPLQ
jgi:hypothetical protein